MSERFRFIIFAVFGFFIGVVDFRIKKIPNIVLFVLAGILMGIDILWNPTVIPFYLLSGLGAYGLFYTVYRFWGGLGYGDVKYAGVIGYYLGPGRVLYGLLYAVLAGMFCWCVGCLLFRWGKEKRLPFGPWLSCGAAAAGLLHRSMS